MGRDSTSFSAVPGFFWDAKDRIPNDRGRGGKNKALLAARIFSQMKLMTTPKPFSSFRSYSPHKIVAPKKKILP
jgi:hypothetical protein